MGAPTESQHLGKNKPFHARNPQYVGILWGYTERSRRLGGSPHPPTSRRPAAAAPSKRLAARPADSVFRHVRRKRIRLDLACAHRGVRLPEHPRAEWRIADVAIPNRAKAFAKCSRRGKRRFAIRQRRLHALRWAK